MPSKKKAKPRRTRFRFFYTGIRVRDMKESLDFYTKVLGMKIARRGKMPHGGEYVGLRTPGSRREIELNWYPPGTKFYTEYAPGEEMDHLAFFVDSVAKAYDELKKRGVSVAIPPEESEGTEVYVKDPNGIWIELLG